MRVLGIDPGTALMGYGVVNAEGSRMCAVAFGKIETPSDLAHARRLLILHQRVCELIAEHDPDVLAVEELFFGRNVTTAVTVGQARGVVLLAAAQAGIEVAEYSPMQVKQAVTGYGRADKQQVQAMIQRILGLAAVPRPDDVADALAVALCGVTALPMERRLRRSGP